MKLRARFPQIGLAPADGASKGPALRRAFWPTSRSGATLPAEPPVQTAASEAVVPAPAFAPVITSEFAPPLDWPSTVAAWRSTTGKPGDPA